jgi:hypothetical protein
VDVPLAGPVPFEAVPLNLAKLAAGDRGALADFQRQTARLQRAGLGARQSLGEAASRLNHLELAWRATPGADAALLDRIDALQARVADLRTELLGDETVANRNEPTPPAILDRIQRVVYGNWTVTSAPTTTHRRGFEIAAEGLAAWLPKLTTLIETDLVALEADLDAAGAPWTPGRVPRWQPE